MIIWGHSSQFSNFRHTMSSRWPKLGVAAQENYEEGELIDLPAEVYALQESP